MAATKGSRCVMSLRFPSGQDDRERDTQGFGYEMPLVEPGRTRPVGFGPFLTGAHGSNRSGIDNAERPFNPVSKAQLCPQQCVQAPPDPSCLPGPKPSQEPHKIIQWMRPGFLLRHGLGGAKSGAIIADNSSSRIDISIFYAQKNSVEVNQIPSLQTREKTSFFGGSKATKQVIL